MYKVKSFVIDRKEWYRGKSMSALLQKDGTRCCLGIYGKRLGISDEMMLDVGSPDTKHDTANAYKNSNQANWLFDDYLRGGDPCDPCDPIKYDYRSIDCGDLMVVNDDQSITEKEREAAVIRIFAKNGIKVSFRG